MAGKCLMLSGISANSELLTNIFLVAVVNQVKQEPNEKAKNIK